MAKKSNPRAHRRAQELHTADAASVVPFPRRLAGVQQRPKIEPKTEIQSIYMQAILSKALVFGIGPAGTGKTYLPTALAAEALMSKRIAQIIVTRPAVETDESLGFLPGELEEKYEPYLQPVRQVLVERMGVGAFECALKNGKIEPVPLAFMRGRTFEDCWVILDEAQNVTPRQMKMLLTRIGENCKVIVCGDTDQVDISGPSGLTDAVTRCGWIDEAQVVEFEIEDCVRSGLTRKVLDSYRD
jgi:phosphate starvation-inducible PhoH-like protein